MGIADLTGPRAKLGRAYEYAQAAEAEVELMKKTTKTGRMRFWRNNGWCYLRMEALPPLPQQLALIAGDCLNNVRSALDHLVWQLILREDEEPGKHHTFPICETRREFVKEVKVPAQKRKGRSRLDGLPVKGDAWAILEEAQPFHSDYPKHHPLALLALLNNVDKHNTLLVQQALIEVQDLADRMLWRPDAQPIEVQVLVPHFTAKEPADVLRFRFAEGVKPGVYMPTQIPVNPIVSNDKTAIFVNSLEKVRRCVEQIVDKVATLPRVQG